MPKIWSNKKIKYLISSCQQKEKFEICLSCKLCYKFSNDNNYYFILNSAQLNLYIKKGRGSKLKNKNKNPSCYDAHKWN